MAKDPVCGMEPSPFPFELRRLGVITPPHAVTAVTIEFTLKPANREKP